ncbi:hypothetical protein A2U01_0048955, partial [Trifolium medium]|nr:hypothetical protein [Trifolium medium]
NGELANITATQNHSISIPVTELSHQWQIGLSFQRNFFNKYPKNSTTVNSTFFAFVPFVLPGADLPSQTAITTTYPPSFRISPPTKSFMFAASTNKISFSSNHPQIFTNNNKLLFTLG